jgi:hypothetical protein
MAGLHQANPESGTRARRMRACSLPRGGQQILASLTARSFNTCVDSAPVNYWWPPWPPCKRSLSGDKRTFEQATTTMLGLRIRALVQITAGRKLTKYWAASCRPRA